MVGLPGSGGLPAGRALHPRFDSHHRPVAEQFHTAQVRIRRRDPNAQPQWDPTAGRSVYPDPVTVWTGWARIQRMSQMETPRSVGDRQVILRSATVSIPADATEVMISDEVEVLEYRDPDAGDPHLVDRPLWVHDVRPGSMLWQRDLVVLDAPPTSR